MPDFRQAGAPALQTKTAAELPLPIQLSPEAGHNPFPPIMQGWTDPHLLVWAFTTPMSGAGLGYGSTARILQDRQCYFDNFHIQKLRSAAITAIGALIQSGIV
jgi:hypothetical protein